MYWKCREEIPEAAAEQLVIRKHRKAGKSKNNPEQNVTLLRSLYTTAKKEWEIFISIQRRLLSGLLLRRLPPLQEKGKKKQKKTQVCCTSCMENEPDMHKHHKKGHRVDIAVYDIINDTMAVRKTKKIHLITETKVKRRWWAETCLFNHQTNAS